MTDRQRVYRKVLKQLKLFMPTATQGHVVTLAMMITGIVIGKKAQLGPMSGEVPHRAQEESIERRFRRWVANARIEGCIYFTPFVEQVLVNLSHVPLVVAIDGSTVGRGCMALMIGVVYKKRTIPLTWLVYRGKKGHASAERHIELLQQLLPLIPPCAEVVLLGDGEFDNIAMLAWVTDNTDWQVVVRTASNLTYRSEAGWGKVGDLPVVVGSRVVRHDVELTQAAYGPLMLIAWWHRDYKEPIYLITTLDCAVAACNYYRKRYRIETFFSDQKSRGFHIHKSHLSDPERLSRLLFAACLAYIWMICLGLFVIANGYRQLIDRTDRRDKSLFRLGMDWLRHRLKFGDSFDVWFILDPLLFNQAALYQN